MVECLGGSRKIPPLRRIDPTVPQFRDLDQPLGTFRQLNDEEKKKSHWSELREDLNAESREHERGGGGGKRVHWRI